MEMALSVSEMATKASPSRDSPTITMRLASSAEPRCWSRLVSDRKNLWMTRIVASLLARVRVVGARVRQDLTVEHKRALRWPRVLHADAVHEPGGDIGRIALRSGEVEQNRLRGIRADGDVTDGHTPRPGRQHHVVVAGCGPRTGHRSAARELYRIPRDAAGLRPVEVDLRQRQGLRGRVDQAELQLVVRGRLRQN